MDQVSPMQAVIKVKDANNTFTARCAGKSASCTANPEDAAKALAKKLWPNLSVNLSNKRMPDGTLEFYVVSSKKLEVDGNQ